MGYLFHLVDENDVWVSDSYYRIYYTITLCNEFLRNSTDEAIAHFTEEEQREIRAVNSEARFFEHWPTTILSISSARVLS